MAKATQFCVGLANKPGSLAKLCAALSRAKVNIEAISVADSTWQLDAGRCVFCAACVAACPQHAVRMGSQVELAARSHDALLVVRSLGVKP